VSDVTKRLMRVGVSGIVATTVDVTALVLLVELLRSHVTIAAFLAASLGGVTNFFINKYWRSATMRRSRSGRSPSTPWSRWSPRRSPPPPSTSSRF
jgi:putative flippase GtrA